MSQAGSPGPRSGTEPGERGAAHISLSGVVSGEHAQRDRFGSAAEAAQVEALLKECENRSPGNAAGSYIVFFISDPKMCCQLSTGLPHAPATMRMWNDSTMHIGSCAVAGSSRAGSKTTNSPSSSTWPPSPSNGWNPEHPARPILSEVQHAAQRCIWKTSGLSHYGARHGVPPSPVPMERLMLEAD